MNAQTVTTPTLAADSRAEWDRLMDALDNAEQMPSAIAYIELMDALIGEAVERRRNAFLLLNDDARAALAQVTP